MITRFIDKKIDYSGAQLRAGWIKSTTEIDGNAAVAFTGSCNVLPEFMVDMEDLEAGNSIYSESMLHFIIEHPGINITEITLRQRIFICIIKEIMEGELKGLFLRREGDDLYDSDSKITISVATTSAVSGLIHTGINISSRNTPVKTKSLNDYGLDFKRLAISVLEKYKDELASIEKCVQKVKKV